jgi:predicted dehydrogenase
MGEQRARVARRLGAEVVLSDGELERARTLAGELGDGVTVMPPGGIDWEALDAVFVCTPAGARGPVETAAARHGVALFVEKPIALSGDHAQPILDAVRRSGVLAAAGYMNRYRAGVTEARTLLAGRDIFAVDGHWVGNPYLKDWWLDPAVSGSPFNDQASHLIDLCRYIAGEIDLVAAVERRAADSPAVADVVAFAVRFASGACGTLLHSWCATDKHVQLSVYSSLGETVLRGWDFRLDEDPGIDRAADVDGVTPIFLTETSAFLEAVRRRDAEGVRSTLEDAYRSLLVVDAVHRSLASGRAEPVGAG